jgi:toxin-antitoxin system PIN domain toxin
MIVPDLNLLVYTYNSDAPQHAAARRWWEASLSGSTSVGLPWVVLMGYVRVMTSRAVLLDPFSPAEAVSDIREWLDQPQVQILVPGPRHLDVFTGLTEATGTAGRLTTDLYLAALAIEN